MDLFDPDLRLFYRTPWSRHLVRNASHSFDASKSPFGSISQGIDAAISGPRGPAMLQR